MKTSSTERSRAPRPGDTVRTAEGRELVLGALLGLGGQGAVFRTTDPATAVKARFLPDTDGRFARRIARIRTLAVENPSLPRLDSYTLPGALLAAPWVGYEMPLLQHAIPLTRLVELPAESPDEEYKASGGLRRRLLIGARVARAMRHLHAAGFVFGDLSPANVLTSADVRFTTIRVIDCDNIGVASSMPDSLYGTPGYWAPELVLGVTAPDPDDPRSPHRPRG